MAEEITYRYRAILKNGDKKYFINMEDLRKQVDASFLSNVKVFDKYRKAVGWIHTWVRFR